MKIIVCDNCKTKVTPEGCAWLISFQERIGHNPIKQYANFELCWKCGNDLLKKLYKKKE